MITVSENYILNGLVFSLDDNLSNTLCRLCSPLSQSQHTVKSTKDFIEKIRNVNIPHGFNMISFDVKFLFSSVPLEETINVALDRIHHWKEIDTSISKNDTRNLLLLCTKNVHFCFGSDIYQQNDSVGMGSPLGPVLAGIFMAELESRIIPTVTDSISHWRGYVDDTFVFIKKGCVEHVLARLKSFHKNFQFTYELENQNKLPFLDVLLIRKGNKIETTVCRKSTNNDICLNWGSFAPLTWKRGTLKTRFNRAYIVCSTNYHLKKKPDHLRYVFQKHNFYPKWIIKQVAKQVKDQNIQSNADGASSNELPSNSTSFTLLLSYTRQKGEYLIRSLRKDMHRTLPENFQTRICYTGSKLDTYVIISKIRLGNPTNTMYSIMLHVPNQAV